LGIGSVFAVLRFNMSTASGSDTRQVTAVVSLQVADDLWLLLAYDGRGWRLHGWRDQHGAEVENGRAEPGEAEHYFDTPGAAWEHLRVSCPPANGTEAEPVRRALRLAV
jgi:hypothetical protein